MDNPENELLRQLFKRFNHFMVLIWRLGLGSWVNGTRWGGAYMVIKHFGRKSGKAYLTPVNYALVGGSIYCTAGFGSKSDWYQNLLVRPVIEVWLPNGRWAGVAQDVTDAPDRVVYFRQVLIASGFAGPLFGENPAHLTDVDLEELLGEYRLIRIDRTAALTGAGGPGDLAWIWPLTTFLLSAKLLHVWKRNRKP
jgi:deazaflavin-dependent oxidoreductase (nitroreductase family)